MRSHVFVDENKSRGLLMVAAACSVSDVTAHRRTMKDLLLPGQRRLHFFKESAARQRKILAVIEGFSLDVKVYVTSSETHAGRERCLNAIVEDAAGVAERLVIERDESRLEFDKQVLYRAVRTHDCVETLRYDLLAPYADSLLWIPDALAWSWAKGGEWRQSVASYCELSEL